MLCLARHMILTKEKIIQKLFKCFYALKDGQLSNGTSN